MHLLKFEYIDLNIQQVWNITKALHESLLWIYECSLKLYTK